MKQQRNAISAFVFRLIFALKSFSSVVQCLFEIFVRHQIVVLRCVFVFSAKFRKLNEFAFFRRSVDLTTFFFRVWISLRLILSQCLLIKALCESLCNLILIFVCRYVKYNSMSCICVSTFKIFFDVMRNVSLIMRKFYFWKFINLFVKNKVVSERSCNACHVLLSYVMTNRTTTLYTCLIFLKQVFQIKIVNLINANIYVIISFWIFWMCESHFNLILNCTFNTRMIIVDSWMMFFTLIVIVMLNRLWFFVKCNNWYLIDAKRTSCRRVYNSQMTWIFFSVLQLFVMLVSYVRMLISFTKFMIVILYLNRSKTFKMFAL